MKTEITDNLVILKLSDYESLKDFKEKTLTGNVFVIRERLQNFLGFYTQQKFLNSKDIEDKVVKINEELFNRNIELEEITDSLERENRNLKDDIAKVKAMSYWEFLKFKRS